MLGKSKYSFVWVGFSFSFGFDFVFLFFCLVRVFWVLFCSVSLLDFFFFYGGFDFAVLCCSFLWILHASLLVV